jgi:small subunit ribosomal protein S16
MLVIRLARQGRTKYPVYRVVAADQRRAATSKYVANLGHYNPHTKEIVLHKEKIEMYLSNGAQASDRVLRLLKAEGIKLPAWATTHDRNKAPKKVEEAAEATPEAPADGVETAEAEAEAAEPKAEEEKVDVGTAKEADEPKVEKEATEKAADAAVAEAQKEQAEKQPE